MRRQQDVACHSTLKIRVAQLITTGVSARLTDLLPCNATMSSRRKRQRRDVASLDNDAPLELETSLRRVPYCITWGFHSSQCCSGCINWSFKVNLDIDSRDPFLIQAMKSALNKRQETHGKTKECRCQQPWKQEANTIVHCEHGHVRLPDSLY